MATPKSSKLNYTKVSTAGPKTFSSVAESNAATALSNRPKIQPAAAESVPIVRIFLTFDGTTKQIYTIEQDMISRHSKTVRNIIEAMPSEQIMKDVYLTGTSPDPLKLVLNLVRKYGKKGLRIRAGYRPLDKAVMLLQAIEVLEIKPRQPWLERHIIRSISNHIIEPAGMVAVKSHFGPKMATNKVYNHMLINLALAIKYNLYPAEALRGLYNEAKKHPNLLNEIENKLHQM